jgi:hypothetical protein
MAEGKQAMHKRQQWGHQQSDVLQPWEGSQQTLSQLWMRIWKLQMSMSRLLQLIAQRQLWIREGLVAPTLEVHREIIPALPLNRPLSHRIMCAIAVDSQATTFENALQILMRHMIHTRVRAFPKSICGKETLASMRRSSLRENLKYLGRLWKKYRYLKLES